MGALILPDPSDKKARSRAFAIRRKLPKGTALPGEADWLKEYDAAKAGPGNNAAKATRGLAAERVARSLRDAPPDPPAVAAPSRGEFAAASSRKVMHVEEETRQVQASGDPAVMAAAMAAATAREEGRRYDYLLDAAVGSQRFVIEQLLKRNGELERAQIDMMEAIRERYVAQTQAEIDGMTAVAVAKKEAEEEGGDEVKLLKAVEQLGQLMPMFQQLMSGKGAATPTKP